MTEQTFPQEAEGLRDTRKLATSDRYWLASNLDSIGPVTVACDPERAHDLIHRIPLLGHPN